MDKYATQEFAPRPNMCEGRTVQLTNWAVVPDCDAWCLVHYVGGEEYEVHHGYFERYAAAKREAHLLNTRAKPLTFTHTYEVE
ncbi:hypothetical protein DRQ25_18310 [Candidatus Fermentibacteria bacterium]|nr:MAG: hypothetical protein DRQ25_18310 [Candidatus Fermentibacteria bacterium]